MKHLHLVGAGLLVALFCSACEQSSKAEVPSAVATGPAQTSSPKAEDQNFPPVELAGTAVHELRASGTERQYQVWVSLPASYSESSETYPVVFVTDAAYSFPLVRSIRNLLGQRGRHIEDFILVGLPPEQGLTSKESRSRDYTPSNPLHDPARRAKVYSASQYGEAAAYRDYIESQVFPLIARHYRADMERKVFAGHSLGSLFGSYVLLTKPGMFQSYILGSPSLWFDKHEILRHEETYADNHTNLDANVMMYIGMYETIGPSERHSSGPDMVGDMQYFERRLQSRKYSNLFIGSEVIKDEGHLEVFPSLISRGLIWALPGRDPNITG
ncbi:alpha/beta hydrolase [Lysobacter sp. D1-1-M9]|uniref:alpha/beta hydrolase n=1 Tax=Novilysobacter longmucuonensis TaxID=3098603 RepID=UPI002FC64902